ncbi:MAG: oligosaccharide flippase family protein [Firmicutes bacterium]|nr:oligosaccharide flippase family protein [Bacillota bacterium]
MKTALRPYLKKYVLLTFSSLLLRVYGQIYRLFLLRCFGTEPFGLLGMIFPFYRLLSLLITMGLPTALVRLIAIEQAKKNIARIRQAKKKVFTLVATMAAVVSGLLFLFAAPLGVLLYNDLRTGPLLKYYALALIFHSLCLVYRGYYHGLDRISPLAFADLAETLGETVFILLFLLAGPRPPLPVEAAGRILAKGVLLGEAACLGALFLYDRYRVRPQLITTTTTAQPAAGRKLLPLLRSSFPFMAQQLILSLARIAESVLLPNLLAKGGLTPSQIAHHLGEYWEMATPFLLFPLFLFSPVSTLILPATARATVKNNLPDYLRKLRRLLSWALLYSIGVGLFLLKFAQPLSLLLYKTTAATRYLPYLLPALPFMTMNSLLIPVAEGLGKQLFLLRATLILIFIKTGITAAFVPLPAFGLVGAAWGLTVSQALLFCLLLKETFFPVTPNSKWFLLVKTNLLHLPKA